MAPFDVSRKRIADSRELTSEVNQPMLEGVESCSTPDADTAAVRALGTIHPPSFGVILRNATT
jgi:hypothetical protein